MSGITLNTTNQLKKEIAITLHNSDGHKLRIYYQTFMELHKATIGVVDDISRFNEPYIIGVTSNISDILNVSNIFPDMHIKT